MWLSNFQKEKEAMDRKSYCKKGYTEKSSKSENKKYRKIAKV